MQAFTRAPPPAGLPRNSAHAFSPFSVKSLDAGVGTENFVALSPAQTSDFSSVDSQCKARNNLALSPFQFCRAVDLASTCERMYIKFPKSLVLTTWKNRR